MVYHLRPGKKKHITMTQVKMNNRSFGPAFNSMFDELINGLPVLFADEWSGSKNQVPVNIKEKADAYVLDLAAPGFEKTDFKVNLDGNLLTISAEQKNETAAENEKQVRREFKVRNFKRSFTIDEKIDATGIGASYINGILTLNLPKKVEVKEAVKEITIN